MHLRTSLLAASLALVLCSAARAQQPSAVAVSLSDSQTYQSAPDTFVQQALTDAGYISQGSDESAVELACASAACDTGCDSVGICTTCDSAVCICECPPWWAHRSGGFGEVLYLSPGSSDLIYAVEQADTSVNASPTGPIGLSNIDEHVGYRVGLVQALSDCSSIVATYARWDGDTDSSLNANSPYVLNSQLIHPSVATTGAASLSADAHQLINFQIADVLIRKVYRSSDCGVINWNGGIRYGNLEQGLVGRQTVAVATGLTTVTTDIDFSGVGILGGIDGERRAPGSGFSVYGKVMGSLLAGNWQADYTQVNQFGGGVIANIYEDFRITPVVESELGFGWQSKGGGLKLSTGYLFSTWFNAVNNRDYIQAVRTGNLLELDESISFSGLVFRTELRL